MGSANKAAAVSPPEVLPFVIVLETHVFVAPPSYTMANMSVKLTSPPIDSRQAFMSRLTSVIKASP
jgi:hypothetical protein